MIDNTAIRMKYLLVSVCLSSLMFLVSCDGQVEMKCPVAVTPETALFVAVSKDGGVVVTDNDGEQVQKTDLPIKTTEISIVKPLTILRDGNACYMDICDYNGCRRKKISNGPCPQL